MKWKSSFRVSLLSVWFLANFSLKHVISATSTSTTETLPAESTTVVAGILDSGTWKYPKLCYVQKSKVNELMTRMNQTVQILNRRDAILKCGEKVETAVVNADGIELCDDDRILKIQKDLSEVAAGLFQLAIRLSEPSEEDVLSLDLKKFQLLYDLKALRVFYGPSPCNENSIALYPFQPLVEYVEWNLNQVFALFQTTRPTRSAPTAATTTSTILSTTPKLSEEDMLSPYASFVELTEIAQSNPRALPRIVSQRYNEKSSTFDKLLAFSKGLSTTENQIFGVCAIHDEMYRYSRNPEIEKLMKMAKTVEHLNQTASTSSVNEAATAKLNDLIRDPDLSPIFVLQNPLSSYTQLTESARSNPTAMSIALPEIVSQRYNASDSSFEDLLNFIEGLPTAENRIFGFAAVNDEILRYSRRWDLPQILRMTKTVKRLNDADAAGTSSGVTSSSQSKLADLVHSLSPLILIGEKADCSVTNVAYQLHLSPIDYGSPKSAFLDTSDYRVEVFPKVEDGRLVFQISQGGAEGVCYASDTNLNTDSWAMKYQTQPSERYVLWQTEEDEALPSDAELDWRFVPIKNKANQFKILSAKSDDFMFAHQSATAYPESYRRVLLGRKSYSSHDHIPEADNWTFDCKPGTFPIPTDD